MSASHRLVGFPPHFAYADTKAIAEGIHLCRYLQLFLLTIIMFSFTCREPGVEFALAVQVIKMLLTPYYLVRFSNGHCRVGWGITSPHMEIQRVQSL